MQLKKPWGITINVVLLLLSGILMLLGTLGLTMGASIFEMIDELVPIMGFIGIIIAITAVIGLLMLILAYYLWEGHPIAWWITIVFMFIGLLTNVIGLLSGSMYPVVTIAIQAFLVLSLLHKDTISYVKPGIEYRGWQLEG